METSPLRAKFEAYLTLKTAFLIRKTENCQATEDELQVSAERNNTFITLEFAELIHRFERLINRALYPTTRTCAQRSN